MTARIGRAAPLPPDERRAAIIAATLPLVRVHGRSVTSRQIAHAAGIAEGTIFRVFPDKEALLDAAVTSVFDPGPTMAAIQAIDVSAPIEQRVAAVVEILSRRLAQVWSVLALMADAATASMRARIAEPRKAPMAEFLPELAALMTSDAHRMSVAPDVAARMLRAMIFGSVHPILAGGDPLETDQIVALFLHGVLNEDGKEPAGC